MNLSCKKSKKKDVWVRFPATELPLTPHPPKKKEKKKDVSREGEGTVKAHTEGC